MQAQTNPDLGDTLTICYGRSDTITISIANQSYLEFASGLTADTPYRYRWMILINNYYQVIEDSIIGSLDNIPDLQLPLSLISNQNLSKIRLEIWDSVWWQYSDTTYSIIGRSVIYGDKVIIVSRPSISYSSNVVCERQYVPITITNCDLIDNSPYSYVLIYSDSNNENYGDTLAGSFLWNDSSQLEILTPDLQTTGLNKDEIIVFKALVKGADGSIQESEVDSITILNSGYAATSSFGYLCNDSFTIIGLMNGAELLDSFNYKWYKYDFEEDTYSFLLQSSSNQLIVTDTGEFAFVGVRLDIASGVSCGTMSNRIHLIQSPTPTIVSGRTELTSGVGDTIILTLQGARDQSIIQWYKMTSDTTANLIEDSAGLTLSVNAPGDYVAVLYNQSGIVEDCSFPTTTISITSTLTSVNSRTNLRNGNLQLFPNPANNSLNFKINDFKASSDKILITVIDNLGRVSLTYRNDASNGILDISKLSEGIYLVKFEFEKSGVTLYKSFS